MRAFANRAARVHQSLHRSALAESAPAKAARTPVRNAAHNSADILLRKTLRRPLFAGNSAEFPADTQIEADNFAERPVEHSQADTFAVDIAEAETALAASVPVASARAASARDCGGY